MDRLRNTVRLSKTSWHVLQKDRELALLPVIGFAVTLLVLAVFVVPGLLSTDWDATTASGSEEPAIPALSVILFVLGAVGAAVVNVFFVGAVVAGAHERLTGGDPTVRSALGRAVERLPGLVPWAILNWVVISILRALRERAGWIGNLFFGGLEVAFDVATFLTVPAIVIDEKGPIEGFKTSAHLLRTTWGENLAARVGFGLLGFVAIVPAVLLAIALGATGVTVLTFAGIVFAALWIGTALAVLSTMNGIFQAALYLYATTGSAPQGFENAGLNASFARR